MAFDFQATSANQLNTTATLVNSTVNTVSFWWKPTASASNWVWSNHKTSGGPGGAIQLQLSANITLSNEFTIRIYNGAYTALGYFLSGMQWNHIVVCCDGTYSYGFRNGTLVGAAAATYGSTGSGSVWAGLGAGVGGFHVDGSLCDMATWDGVCLGAVGARKLYQGISPTQIARGHLTSWLPAFGTSPVDMITAVEWTITGTPRQSTDRDRLWRSKRSSLRSTVDQVAAPSTKYWLAGNRSSILGGGVK